MCPACLLAYASHLRVCLFILYAAAPHPLNILRVFPHYPYTAVKWNLLSESSLSQPQFILNIQLVKFNLIAEFSFDQ
jgi:hypothetical protein